MRAAREAILPRVAKPGRYSGGEIGQYIKERGEVYIDFAFAFPDLYEIGMSNLGVRILYDILNKIPDVWCQRAYCPWGDMEAALHEAGLPLWAHEEGLPLDAFDIIGFTLQYELSYTNVLCMLELGGVPLRAADRGDGDAIVIGGGPCACNPEPLCDFFDLLVLGDGEEVIVELVDLYRAHKQRGLDRRLFLQDAAQIQGVYVPSLYCGEYNPDGTLRELRPVCSTAPHKVKKRIVRDLDAAPFPETLVMPYIETIHDRIVLEAARGCIRGCRFCQAGMIYRPTREKSAAVLDAQARALFKKTGYDEISMCSLSITDHTHISEVAERLLKWTTPNRVSLSLPSLRVDAIDEEMLDSVYEVRQSSLTFAPEAGTQRLRDVINKNITQDDMRNAVRAAYSRNRTTLKLYFMLGLPTERDEDVTGIAELASDLIGEHTRYKHEQRDLGNIVGGSAQATISCAVFVPKPHTPFQWEAQDSCDEIVRKQRLLRDSINSRKIKYNWHDAKASRLEAVFARGDRRLGRVLEAAYRTGARFDGWDECFDFARWERAFADCGLDMDFYACRVRDPGELLPWDHLDMGVSKAFLLRERRRAIEEERTTRNCREGCEACGAGADCEMWTGA